MKHFSRRQADELKWVSLILFLAAVYNGAWGIVATIAPVRMLELVGITNPGYTGFWQCIGMFVALYGVCYWLASKDPVRYWPFIMVGLAGKVLGPAGAILSISNGQLPVTFLWVNVTNDFIWWAPFAWTLFAIRRWDLTSLAPAGSKCGPTLYRRLIGSAFDELSPHVRHFHDATQPIEVRGVFRVTRGSSRLGNWLTGIARFPRSHEALDVSLIVEQTARGEIWRRSFAGTIIESRQFEAQGFLAERFGPVVIYLQPRAVAGSLEIVDVRSTFLGVPLPPLLAPEVYARGIDADHGVDILVRISCRPLGLLVEYKGTVG